MVEKKTVKKTTPEIKTESMEQRQDVANSIQHYAGLQTVGERLRFLQGCVSDGNSRLI